MTARPAKSREPAAKERLGCASISDRAVNGPLELGFRDVGRHPNDRRGRRGASQEPFTGASVDEGDFGRRTHETHRAPILQFARHKELDWSFRKAVEAVESSSSPTADEGILTELKLTRNEDLPPRHRLSYEAEGVAPHSFQLTSSNATR
jgi:hypothetical protein